MLVFHLNVQSMIDLKGLFELQLEEGVFVDVRSVEANLAVLVVDTHLRVREFVRGTSVDLAIESFVWLRRSELSRDERSVLVEATDSVLVDIAVDHDALLEQLLNHLSELLVVGHQFVELVLV